MPAVGTPAPPLRVRDQDDRWRTPADLSGPNGWVLLFYRGHWCPFCLHQLFEYEGVVAKLRALGYELAALSVDPPERSAALRDRLHLSFPLLCDPERAAVVAWDVFNAGEKGGIAHPATAIVAASGELRWFERERMTSRLSAAGVLALVRAVPGEPTPAPRSYFPRGVYWRRALANAFRFGVRSPVE